MTHAINKIRIQNMTIKHHNIFKVYLPKNISENTDSFTPEMFLEEAYLWSNGSMTPDFKPNDSERNPLDVVLFPSFIFASKKLHQTETEQTEYINERIDVEFCKMLLWVKPIYRLTEFIDYHYSIYQDDKNIFFKHIKFVILPLIKIIIENNSNSKDLMKEEYPAFSDVAEIIQAWLIEKEKLLNPQNEMPTHVKFETKIKKAKNIIVNNDSNIDNQSNMTHKPSKKTLTIIGLIISGIMLIIAIVTNWNKIF